MATVKERANAKVNLYLDVLSRREDGFHEIKTVMHSVMFGDEVSVTVVPSEKSSVKLNVIGNKFLPTDTKNIAVKAAYLFLERIGLSAEVSITLAKRIPVAAGLAGGSSDAAAVLRAMNKIYSKFFTVQALTDMAAGLGSDVVYCLYGKTALCEGRGERITRLPVSLDAYFVIAIANERVSTPQAYKTLDEYYSDFDGTVKTGGEAHYDLLIDSLKCGEISHLGVFNAFEAPILKQCKGAAAIREKLTELGAKCAMMSGSGPAVFGVFDSFDKAKAACSALRAMRYKAYYAKSV